MNLAPLSTPTETLGPPPRWYRLGLIAVVTLLLCSCQAIDPSRSTLRAQQIEFAQIADQGREPETQAMQHSGPPALYQKPNYQPPPVERQLEYAAGIRPAPCPCHPGDQSRLPQSGPTTTCTAHGLVGPRDEYLCDGGDGGAPAGVRADWVVEGLEQEDTVGHYDTVDGRTILTPSNPVCIYAPRFGVVRRVIDLHQYARYDQAGGFDSQMSLAKIDESEEAVTSLQRNEPTIHRLQEPSSLLRERQHPGGLERELAVAEYDGLLAPYADLQMIRAGQFTNDERALIARGSLAAITWSDEQAVQVTLDSRRAQAEVSEKNPGVVYHLEEPNSPRLRLCKLASTATAQPGEEVEFTLRFDNIGNREMGNVTIVDNLTTRLEYIEGSAESSVEANFSTARNEGGSLVLRWEIIDPIEPGEGGIIQFQCRVR